MCSFLYNGNHLLPNGSAKLAHGKIAVQQYQQLWPAAD